MLPVICKQYNAFMNKNNREKRKSEGKQKLRQRRRKAATKTRRKVIGKFSKQEFQLFSLAFSTLVLSTLQFSLFVFFCVACFCFFSKNSSLFLYPFERIKLKHLVCRPFQLVENSFNSFLLPFYFLLLLLICRFHFNGNEIIAFKPVTSA